jgi:hypothetical protein
MVQGNRERGEPVSRRAALKALGAGVGALTLPALSPEAAATLAAIQRTGAAPAPRVLTPGEYATVDALAETIIPADEHSPGASAARVADYVDLLLADADAAVRATWSAGLVALDAAAVGAAGETFAALTPAQRAAVLTPIAERERSPERPVEHFFRTAKEATIRGYYTSAIGVHRDLQYKGNQFVRSFTGCTHPEHSTGSRG